MEHPSNTIRLFKTPQLPVLAPETLKLIIKFVKFSGKKLGTESEPVKIRLLHAAPKEPITTGAYTPQTKTICVIVQNRHFIDYCRTVAHEMTHQRQHTQGKDFSNIAEIGGEIEDEANSVSGQIVKEFIKKQLTPEEKKHLGLGSY